MRGCLTIVGIGPGDEALLTTAAAQALREAEVIAGYKGYLDLVSGYLKGKEIISSGMRREQQRAREAIEAAIDGKKVAVISSGDAGIYGMAGLVLEGLPGKTALEIRIIPGVTAASAAASLLGAPLMNDFAVISLSDLLTAPETIEKRLHAAAMGDFVTVLYNPKSRKRQHLLRLAFRKFRENRKPETPVGIVRNAYREGQEVTLTTLQAVDADSPGIDMFSVIIIGNSSSIKRDHWFVTLRGYPVRREPDEE